MSSWIDYTALWEIIVIGLLAGAGLPALFALGLRVLGPPGRGRGDPGRSRADAGALAGGHPAGIAAAALCFAIVLASIGYGIYIIVASGHK